MRFLSPKFHRRIRADDSNLLSRALTTHHIPCQDENCFSLNSHQTCICSDNKSGSFILNLLSQLQQQKQRQHGYMHTPYVLNKIISSSENHGFYSVGIQAHSTVIKLGFGTNVHINSALVDLYGKYGSLSCAQQMFDEMPFRNTVTWNSLISCYVHVRQPEIAIELLIEMLRTRMTPTPFTLSTVLVGCAQLETQQLGAQVHGLSFKVGAHLNVFVGTGLVDMYSKCSNIEASRLIFDQILDKNLVTWTSMVSGYGQNEQPGEAMNLVNQMLHLGFKSNCRTYNSLLSSFCHPDDLNHCKQVHCRIILEGLESNAYLAVTLLTVYSECSSSLKDYKNLCSNITVWDQVSCNSVIAGFCNLENEGEALVCFSRMRQEGISIDFFTLTSIFRATAAISALELGKQTHALAIKTGFASNVYVQNGLVSMYARCGMIEDSKKTFASMDEHDLVSWNSLLSGCANHGHGDEVVEMFEQMRKLGIKPNLTTYLAVLSACSHVGLLDKGLEYFDLMKNDDPLLPPPKPEHYACIVDLYGRAGHLHEAEDFIYSMPIEPGPSVFKSLLSACQVHGNMEIAERFARKLMQLWPDDHATYILLANLLAAGGNWEHAAGVHQVLCDMGVRKKLGYSRI